MHNHESWPGISWQNRAYIKELKFNFIQSIFYLYTINMYIFFSLERFYSVTTFYLNFFGIMLRFFIIKYPESLIIEGNDNIFFFSHIFSFIIQ